MKPDLAGFFGHHKCATTWVRYLVERLCSLRGDRWAVFDNPRQFDGDLAGTIQRRRLDFIAYTNANRRHLAGLPPFRGFHVVRDPRDILVSAYFSHLSSHPTEGWPELEGHRQQLRQQSREDGLIAEMGFSASVFEDIATWDYGRAEVLELRFEDLVARPYETMLEAFAFVDMVADRPATAGDYAKLALHRATGFLEGRMKGRLRAIGRLERPPVEVLLAEIHQRRFSRLAGGRAPGVENRDSHYRKGEPGDWRNHFTPAVEQAFRERFGDLAERLGYEW